MADMGTFETHINELEFKYNANHISVDEFTKFAQSLDSGKLIDVSSWDIYFSGGESNALPFEFVRYRQGPKPELTIKVKSTDKNNNDRLEVDVPLNPETSSDEMEKAVAAFVGQIGFSFNVKIYKSCQIYLFPKTSLVYYVTFDSNMKEVGRYVEVEASKSYPFASKEEAWNEVMALESKLSALNITSKNRMKKSQWEINRK